MNGLKKEILEKELTNKIIKSFYEVYNKLGYGFLEKVYERSLIIEFTKQEIDCENQKPISVFYNDIRVGLLLNFGKEPKFKRMIFENKYKK